MNNEDLESNAVQRYCEQTNSSYSKCRDFKDEPKTNQKQNPDILMNNEDLESDAVQRYCEQTKSS